MYGHTLAAALVGVALAGSSAWVVGFSGDGAGRRPVVTGVAVASPVRPALASRPNRADWETIEQAVRLRRMALQPRRTAAYRSFAAYMALSGLSGLHRLRGGRCTVAVSYVYDNLLDLRQAYAGEHWTSLRRAVAREPSLLSCKPRSAVSFRGYVSYES